MKPEGMPLEIYKRYQSDGFTEDEIQGIWKNTLVMRELMRARQGKPEREITCQNYESAQKRMKNQVSNWLHRK